MKVFAKLPYVVAHRGDHRHWPENSLEAFAAAFDVGADMVEFDVQLSADGVSVIFHDAFLKRMCGIYRLLSAMSVKEVLSHQLKGKVGIPLLTDVFKHLGQRGYFYVELKTFQRNTLSDKVRLCENVLGVIAHHHVKDRVLCVSFDTDVLKMLRKADPHLALGWNMMSADAVYGKDKSVADVVNALCPYAPTLSLYHVQSWHKRGLRVLPWGPRTRAQMQDLWALGVDGITADDVDACLETFAEALQIRGKKR